MKKFAIYLPQFHEFKENNDWWGKGYTEWVPVKNAKPLYNGHMQPKVPLNNNYYCLLDDNVLEWQNKIAKDYGVDGFVYYHYYFSGKLLMDAPIERVFKNKKINQAFFFCWANHSWYKKSSKGHELLIEQKYGNEADWKIHFEYLLKFFKDDRYEKKENKPVFMIYNYNFPEKVKMMDYFDQECKKNGFAGIYIIETYAGDPLDEKMKNNYVKQKSNQTKEVFLREPAVSCAQYWNSLKGTHKQIINKIKRVLSNHGINYLVPRIDGRKLYDIMIERNNSSFDGIKVAPGIFFEWDNTPRHSGRGYIITPPTKEQFKKYMDLISDSDYLIINAWNEWAEGMMLEPTEENKYKYLNWISEWSK